MERDLQLTHWKRWLLLALATAAALTWFISRAAESGFDLRQVWGVLLQTHPPYLFAAVVISLLCYWVRAIRWAVLVEPLRPNPCRYKMFSATAIGFTATTLLGRPGEFVRPYLIARNENISFASQMGAWVVERIYDLLCLVAMFGFALAAVSRGGYDLGPRVQWVVSTGGGLMAGLSLGCFLALVLIHRHVDYIETKLVKLSRRLAERHHEKMTRLITTTLDGLRSVQSRSAVARLLFWSAVEWVLIALLYRAMVLSFPSLSGLTWVDTLILLGFVGFGNIVQIPGVGGGVQIVTVLVLTEFFHCSLEEATGFAAVLWLFIFVTIVPIGLWFAFREGVHWKSLRNITPEASGS